MTRRLVVIITALVVVLAPATAQTARPRLVVVLVVDQMRSDYIDQYGRTWTGGLRRLLDRGARFKDAAYPYLNTVTCPGHGTVATGAFPWKHGLVANFWYDRAAGRRVGCTDDPATALVSYARPTDDRNSPKSLQLPTFADELRAQNAVAPKVATMSLKERTAITLAGRRSDATVWFNDKAQGFVTTTAYTNAPAPFLEAFFRTHPIEGDHGKTWSPMLSADRYQYSDAGAAELPQAGWTPMFPHALAGARGSPDRQFFDQWKGSPFSDAYLSALAQAAVTALQMGKGNGTDYLAISFSALDTVGHRFGPRSHEVQDLLLRLDATIGGLLKFLDDAVGPDRYVVAVTADHGVSTVPEQLVAEGADAGRSKLDDIRARIEDALTPLGKGPHVARVEYADLYFADGVYDRIVKDDTLMAAVTKAILSAPGIAKVFRAEDVASKTPTSDPDLQSARLSYFPGRSGDMINILKPNWIHVTVPASNTTTHGTRQPYDARVPVLLMGPGVRAGSYEGPATPADIAPTLAAMTGIKMPNAEGRVLTPPRAK